LGFQSAQADFSSEPKYEQNLYFCVSYAKKMANDLPNFKGKLYLVILNSMVTWRWCCLFLSFCKKKNIGVPMFEPQGFEEYGRFEEFNRFISQHC
jgi:hypothetical protein